MVGLYNAVNPGAVKDAEYYMRARLEKEKPQGIDELNQTFARLFLQTCVRRKVEPELRTTFEQHDLEGYESEDSQDPDYDKTLEDEELGRIQEVMRKLVGSTSTKRSTIRSGLTRGRMTSNGSTWSQTIWTILRGS